MAFAIFEGTFVGARDALPLQMKYKIIGQVDPVSTTIKNVGAGFVGSH